MVSTPARNAPAHWWVNQRHTFDAERAEGIMWAPKLSQNGRQQSHWETMRDVQPGDRIVHYVDGVIMAVGVAATSAFDSRRPPALGDERWEDEGRMVRVNYTTLTRPIGIDEIPAEHRTASPFNSAHKVLQGYLFPIDPEVLAYLTSTFAELTWDVPYAARYVPDEAREDAAELLRGLLGVQLWTPAGQPNTILEMGPGDVLVATGRTPSGTRVPIKWVAEALERLADEGALTISVDEVGYRSAFIGAVLRTLPGARLVGNPPTITFEPEDGEPEPEAPAAEPSGPPAGAGYEGPLNKAVSSTARAEQPKLRAKLLGAAKQASCAICDVTYPVKFVWAAHIKKRANCTEDEARDLDHIAMIACLFGCDVLYEAGLIAVNGQGRVITSPTVQDSSPLGQQLAPLRGRLVAAFTDTSRKYFEWHRTNTFLGPA
ncbi:hypothetical protein [Catellatospora chokoriensis]|uniref:HNH endonuclease n=1 Tax=Catellatospora chokoriensis TaxID=310353 RepID=A0A8J3K401_9ACTN|nr:hypothetical protein [Catellatospora chokoriensis]GIF92716.1 hypothetical protein Cch02nite_61600 [Catellatospora chokoriensis]